MTTFRRVKHNCPNDLEQFGTEGRYINPRYVEAGRCSEFRIGDVITFCKRFSDLRPWPYLAVQTNPRRLAWHTSLLWGTSALHLLVRLRRHAVSFYQQAGQPVQPSQFAPQPT
jgi:hypothetical protein